MNSGKVEIFDSILRDREINTEDRLIITKTLDELGIKKQDEEK